MANIRIEIVDLASGAGIKAHLDAIWIDHPGQDFHVDTDENGVFLAGLGPGNYEIRITSQGYVPFIWPVHIEGDGTIRQGLTKSGTGNSIIVRNREFMANGIRYKPKIATDFLLVYKKSQGVDIKPILEQRKRAGADMLRIFTCCYNIAKFDPRSYDVIRHLGETLDEIHSFDMRAEVEGFADVQLIGLTAAEQQHHHNLVSSIIRDRGSMDLYDLCNEYDKNGIEPNDFSKPAGVVSSRGSRQGNKPPHAPYWDFCTFHSRRDGDNYYFSKFLADMTPQSELYMGVEGEPEILCPIINDEPIGFQSLNDPGKRSNNPAFAYRLGVVYGMFLNGSCFHSTQGVYSDMFDEVTTQCAIAYFMGCDDSRQGW